MARTPPNPSYILTGLPDGIHCLLYDVNSSQNKELLYCGTGDGKMIVWDLRTCEKRAIVNVSAVACLSIHKIDAMVVTQDKENCIKLWTVDGWKHELFKCVNCKPQSTFCKIHVSPDGSLFVGAEVLCSVVAFSHSDDTRQSMQAPKNYGEVVAIRIVDFSDVRHVLVFYETGILALWNLKTTKIASQLTVPDWSDEVSMAMDYDYVNKRGVLGTSGSHIRSFSVTTQLVNNEPYALAYPGVSSLKIRLDGKVVAAGCWDRKIRVFAWNESAALKLLAVLEAHRDAILDIVFSPERIVHWPKTKFLMAVASADKKISIWENYL